MRTSNRTEIGLIVSVAAECRTLAGELKMAARRGFQAYEGRIAGKNIVLVVSGMGKVNAAHAATLLMERYSPLIVMNIGIGGAYPSSGLAVGDIAIAGKEIYGDEGVLLKDGFHGTELIGIPLARMGRRKYFNEFPLDRALADRAVSAASLLTPCSSRKGVFVTVSACTGTKKRAIDLERRYGAICENMEGAAIAHICMLHGTPFFEMRGISNIVGQRDLSRWNINLAAKNCQKAVIEYIRAI